MILDELLNRSCASIQSRIRREILREDPASLELASLQERILEDPAVQAVFQSQLADGWIGWAFHGYNSMESAIRILSEKDVEPSHTAFSFALEALEQETSRLERGIGKAGRYLDEAGLGGPLTIRAALLAQAGRESSRHVQEQIPLALDAFSSITLGSSLEDFTEVYKGQRIFLPGVVWPCVYHLRLLAFTSSWRSPENSRIINAAITSMCDWSPIPQIYYRNRSQLIAPASFAMHDFASKLTTLDNAGWMTWFHRMELLSRLTTLSDILILQDQVLQLESILMEGDGWFTRPLAHDLFRKWGAYTGLMLEKDWRQLWRRENDLTFRSLLILTLQSTAPDSFWLCSAFFSLPPMEEQHRKVVKSNPAFRSLIE